jgi:hypothetical protein
MNKEEMYLAQIGELEKTRGIITTLINFLDEAMTDQDYKKIKKRLLVQFGEKANLTSLTLQLTNMLIRLIPVEIKVRESANIYEPSEIDIEADRRIMEVHDARIEARVRETIRLEQLAQQESDPDGFTQ